MIDFYIKSNSTSKVLTYFLLSSILLWGTSQTVYAQKVDIPSIGNYSYIQTFNGLPLSGSTTFINGTTIKGWYLYPNNNGSVTMSANTGSSTDGFHNFGSAGSTDRALGSAGIPGTPGATGYDKKIVMKNTTGQTIKHFKISYKAEIWYKTTGMSKPVNFTYAKSPVINPDANYSEVTVADLKADINWSGSGGTVNGNSVFVEKKFIIRDINLEPGHEIRFSWIGGNTSWGIGIDDIIIEPTNSIEFFNKQAADLTVMDLDKLSSWGDKMDGSGNAPTSFSLSDQKFNIINYVTDGKGKLSKDWEVTGTGSKIIFGNNITPIEMTLADKKSITKGPIDLASNVTLIIEAPALPQFGTLDRQSTVILSKLAPTDINSDVEFGNLVIDSGKKNKLTKKLKVNGKLDLKEGKIDLTDFDLEMGYDSQIINGTSANYIIASGNGRLKHGVKPNQEVTLPVGSATTYNPVKIKAASNSQSDMFSVRVVDGIYKNYINNIPVLTSLLTTNNVNKTWLIDEDVKGGSNITLTLTWSATDALLGFDPLKCYVRHYENGAWDAFVANAAINQGIIGLPTTTYSVSRPGIKSFSPYSVESGPGIGPMPVELLHFNATVTPSKKVELTWATTQEVNSNFFDIERSEDGLNYKAISRINAVGTTSNRTDYRFTDNAPLPQTSYYRLRQVDLDGRYEFMPVRAVNLGKELKPMLSLYPNPALSSDLQIMIQGLTKDEEASLLITDMAGKSIHRQKLLSDAIALPSAGLKPGIYIVNVAWKDSTQKQKLIIK